MSLGPDPQGRGGTLDILPDHCGGGVRGGTTMLRKDGARNTDGCPKFVRRLQMCLCVDV